MSVKTWNVLRLYLALDPLEKQLILIKTVFFWQIHVKFSRDFNHAQKQKKTVNDDIIPPSPLDLTTKLTANFSIEYKLLFAAFSC